MRRTHLSRLDPAVLLVALLVVANVLAVVGMMRARRDARTAVREGLELETRADARAFEARLSSELAQLEFLAASPPLAAVAAIPDGDPVARRWARLDLEATLLLYLQASSAVVRLRVRDPGEVWALVERRGGVPSLGTPDAVLPYDVDLLRASWRLGGDEPWGELEAWVDPRPLVANPSTRCRGWAGPPPSPAGSSAPTAIRGCSARSSVSPTSTASPWCSTSRCCP
jgi:hypothetical protein